jgi:hypothetical protein
MRFNQPNPGFVDAPRGYPLAEALVRIRPIADFIAFEQRSHRGVPRLLARASALPTPPKGFAARSCVRLTRPVPHLRDQASPRS